MNEAEWLSSADPAAMLAHVRDMVSHRKLRLFAVAACRLCWDRLADPSSRKAVEVAERYADGETGERERREAWLDVPGSPEKYVALAARDCLGEFGRGRVWWMSPDYPVPPAAQAALLRCLAGNPWRPVRYVYECGRCRGHGLLDAETGLGADEGYTCHRCGGAGLTRPEWISPTVVALATAAYAERRPCPRCGGLGRVRHADMEDEEPDVPCPSCHGDGSDGLLDPARLAVLADALEEAGCDGADVLAHLRSPGPHARGCWALDLVLGRS